MATGESFRSLSFGFHVFHSYLSKIVQQTLAILKSKLDPIFILIPSIIDFKSKAVEFSYKWNFPDCILAIYSKHITYT